MLVAVVADEQAAACCNRCTPTAPRPARPRGHRPGRRRGRPRGRRAPPLDLGRLDGRLPGAAARRGAPGPLPRRRADRGAAARARGPVG
ncbi:hypothetical protein V2I01_00315 [Micromonospora sp. BRA006-A]|nr:hypothetical protein [Micromonospora sp. BRA006-A]